MNNNLGCSYYFCYKQVKLCFSINPAKEHSSAAFGTLGKIVKTLSGFGDIGMSNTETEAIEKCIENAHKYLRNHFSYNLAMESDIGMVSNKMSKINN